MFHNIIILFNYFLNIINKLIWNSFLIIIHPRAEQYFLHTQNVQCVWWNMNCLFSVDFMAIDVRIYMFLNKTSTNNFPFASFPLVQFLLIVLSVKVTYISNDCLAWVAYSQGRASAGSRAHLVRVLARMAAGFTQSPTKTYPLFLHKSGVRNYWCKVLKTFSLRFFWYYVYLRNLRRWWRIS